MSPHSKCWDKSTLVRPLDSFDICVGDVHVYSLLSVSTRTGLLELASGTPVTVLSTPSATVRGTCPLDSMQLHATAPSWPFALATITTRWTTREQLGIQSLLLTVLIGSVAGACMRSWWSCTAERRGSLVNATCGKHSGATVIFQAEAYECSSCLARLHTACSVAIKWGALQKIELSTLQHFCLFHIRRGGRTHVFDVGQQWHTVLLDCTLNFRNRYATNGNEKMVNWARPKSVHGM